MNKCCVCGKELNRASAYVCAGCASTHRLSLSEEQWPAWARSELAREKARRRFRPGYGVSGTDLAYQPYSREQENQAYRRLNGVRKGRPSAPVRVGADNLFYSSAEEGEGADRVYEQVLGTLPGPLQQGLGQGLDLRVVLNDALAALPLVCQRAIRAEAHGFDITAIAQAEGLSEGTVAWLLHTARERLRDILEGKLGADDGARYRPAPASD
jgi:DNA-directed RNA polymerase specialized sigma24 family protein